MNAVCVNNQPLEVKEWGGCRVVTFKDVDRVHQRPEGTAKRAFQSNKKHFIENEDFFLAKPEADKKNEKRTFNIPVRGITLLTETGYLMLVKSFTDDLAWKVQRELVNSYFRMSQSAPVVVEEPKRFLWGGHPVMLIKDACEMLECESKEIYRLLRLVKLPHWVLRENDLAKFKRENDLHSPACALTILTEDHVRALLSQRDMLDVKRDSFRNYFKPEHDSSLSDDQMRLAVEQARILYASAIKLNDRSAKELALKAVTTVLINVGLWNDKHFGFNGATSEWDINSLEGWNKGATLLNAVHHWPYEN